MGGFLEEGGEKEEKRKRKEKGKLSTGAREIWRATKMGRHQHWELNACKSLANSVNISHTMA